MIASSACRALDDSSIFGARGKGLASGGTDRGQESLIRLMFADHCRSAGRDGVRSRLLIVIEAQYDDRGDSGEHGYERDGTSLFKNGNSDVQDDDVWRECENLAECALLIAAVTNHCNVSLQFKSETQHRAHSREVINEKDSNHGDTGIEFVRYSGRNRP